MINDKSYRIAQLGTRHKPMRLFWTGARWSDEKNATGCLRLKDAVEEALKAVETASMDVVVLIGDHVVFKRKPRQRGRPNG